MPNPSVAVPHFNDNGQQVGLAARKALNTMMPEGQSLLPHYRQFSAVWNTISRQYSYRWDEAVKHGRENAVAMWRDGYLQALRQERLYPTAQLNWHIEPEDEDDQDQKALVKDFTKVVRRTPRFSDFRLSLLNAIWYGRYANQQTHALTDVGGNPRYIVADHSPVNGDKIQWTYDKVPCVMINAQWKHPAATIIMGDRSPMLALNTPVWRDKFCIHKHECDDADYFEGEMSGAVHGVGLRTRLHWIYWMRDELLAWVVSFMEKVGTMGVIVISYEENNAKAKEAAEEAGKAYARGNVLLVPRPAGEAKETTSVQLLAANVQGVNYLTTFIQEYFERHIERLFVGQSMSGGEDKSTGFGSSGRAELAANTKYQLLKFDAGRLDETLTTDFIGPLMRLNYPLCKWHFRFVSDIPDPEAKDKLDAAKTFVEMGGTVVEDEIRKPLGFSRPTETDKVLGGQQQPMGQPGPMGGPTTNDGGMEPPKGPPGGPDDQGGGGEEGDILDGINLDVPPSQDLGGINYEAGGQWITIGGKVGDDGKRKGGSPVFVKDGRIVKGHPSLTGKKISNLKEDAEEGSHRQQLSRSRDHAIAKLHKEARSEGIKSKHIKTLADELRAHDREYVNEFNAMLKDARKKLDWHGAAHRTMAAAGKRGKGEVEDKAGLKGLDDVAASMALEYPGMFGNDFGSKFGEYTDYTGKDDAAQILFDYLKEGNREPMTAEEATQEAIKQIRHAIESGAKLQDEPGEAAEVDGDDDFEFGANVEAREEASAGRKAGIASKVESAQPVKNINAFVKPRDGHVYRFVTLADYHKAIDTGELTPGRSADHGGTVNFSKEPLPIYGAAATMSNRDPSDRVGLLVEVPEKTFDNPRTHWGSKDVYLESSHSVPISAASRIFGYSFAGPAGVKMADVTGEMKGESEPHEASHEKQITSIPRGEVGYIGGHPVHHKPDGTFHLETDKYHLHGPDQIADRIRRNWKDQLPDQKRIDAAYERASNWTDPNVFTDPHGSDAMDRKRNSLPVGARAVSLDPNTRGRIGSVIKTDEGIGLRLDHTPNAKVADFEPLDEKHSWRVDRSNEPAAPRPVTPAMFSAFTLDDLKAMQAVAYEAAGVEYKYCSTQFNLPDHIAQKIIEAGERIDDDDLADKGREDEPHVTVKYGIITGDANKVRKIVAGFGPLNCKLGPVSVFEAKGDHDFDVVKLDIISDDLHRLNALIGDSFRCKDKYPTYRPHATIAYVKAGLGKLFAGNHPLVDESFSIDSIEFSNNDGEKTTISLVADYADSPIFYQAEGNDTRDLAQYYCDLWNSIDDAGGTIPEDEFEQVGAELADGGWSIFFDHDAGQWKVTQTNYGNLFGIELYEVLHAPKGGVSVGGKHYVGGQFIPSADQAHWTNEDKAKFKQAAEGSRSRYQEQTKARLQGRGHQTAEGISVRIQPHLLKTQRDMIRNTNWRRSLNSLIQHHGEHVYQRLDELAEHLQSALKKVPEGEEGQRANIESQLFALHVMARHAHHAMGIVPDKGKPKEKPKPIEAPKNAPSPKEAPTSAPQAKTEPQGAPASLELKQTPAYKPTGNPDFDEWQKSYIPAYAQGLPILKGTPKQLRWANELRDRRLNFLRDGAAQFPNNPKWKEQIAILEQIKEAGFFINTRNEQEYNIATREGAQRFLSHSQMQLEHEQEYKTPLWSGGDTDPLNRNLPGVVLGPTTNAYGPKDYAVKALPGDPLAAELAKMGERFDTKNGVWWVRQESAEDLIDAVGRARGLSSEQVEAAQKDLAEDKADWAGKGRYKGVFGDDLTPMPAAARKTEAGPPAETVEAAPSGEPQTLQEALADQTGEKAPEAPKHVELTTPTDFNEYLRQKLGDQYGKPTPARQAELAAEAAKKAAEVSTPATAPEQAKPSAPPADQPQAKPTHTVEERANPFDPSKKIYDVVRDGKRLRGFGSREEAEQDAKEKNDATPVKPAAPKPATPSAPAAQPPAATTQPIEKPQHHATVKPEDEFNEVAKRFLDKHLSRTVTPEDQAELSKAGRAAGIPPGELFGRLQALKQQANKPAEAKPVEAAEEAKPSTPAEAAQPWHGNREDVFAAMRDLDAKNQNHWDNARKLGPRQGMLSVGGADFDHTLQAVVGDEYMRQLRQGKSPEEAHAAALQAGREAVQKWNQQGAKGRVKIGNANELNRWEGAGDSIADNIHRQFTQAVGAKPAQEKAAEDFQKGVKTKATESNATVSDVDRGAQEKAAEDFNKGIAKTPEAKPAQPPAKASSDLGPPLSEATTDSLKEKLRDAWSEYHHQRDRGATNHAENAVRSILKIQAELQGRGENVKDLDRKAQMAAIAKQEAAKTAEAPDLGDDQADQPEPENPDETPRERAARQLDANYAFARQSAIPNVGEDLERSARHRANAWRGLEDAENHGTAAQMMSRAKLLKNEPPVFGAVKPDNAISALLAHQALSMFPPSWDNSYTQAERERDRRGVQRSYERTTGEERSKELRAQYLGAYQAIKKAAEAAAQRPGTDIKEIVGDMKQAVKDKIAELRGGEGFSPHEQSKMKDPNNPIANSLVKLHNSIGTYGNDPLMKRMREFMQHAGKKYGPDAAQNREAIAQHVQDILDGESMADSFGVEKGPGQKRFNPAEMYVSKHAERTGGRMIDTKTVKASSNFLTKDSGMRGLQFGNFVSDDERQHHLKHAAEAFADLTDILGLPDELGSWHGSLGLAFGARGHGTALAHYEPSTKVINLTRKGGVGSLAHEWGHFMDNMLAGGKEGSWASKHSTGSGLGDAMNEWRQAMRSSGFYDRMSGAVSKLKRGGYMGDAKAEYWRSTEECFARTFERYIQHKLAAAGRKNTYLSGTEAAAYNEADGLWPTDKEIAGMAPAFDKIIDHVREQYSKPAQQK